MAATGERIQAGPTQADVDALRWYHTIELPGGVVTPGEYDLRRASARLPWPSLEGKRCLDVGSRDGFYAFEMERRGAASVVSLDIDDPRLIDFPRQRPPDAGIRAELEAGNRAFEFARAALGSQVERRYETLYELDRDAVGAFDFAVVGTLLIHLRDPVAALRAVRGVLDGPLLLNEGVRLGIDAFRRTPLAELWMGEDPFWWSFNLAGLRRVVEAGGFRVTAAGSPYLIANGRGTRRPAVRECLRRPFRHVPSRLLLRRGAPHVWLLAEPVSPGSPAAG